MIKAALTDLPAVYGNTAASALATAYESAILTLSQGEWQHMPNRKVRVTLVEAMMAEGERNGFTSERMAEVGLAAVFESSGFSPSWGTCTTARQRGFDRWIILIASLSSNASQA